MNREQRRKMKKNNNGDKEQLKFIINTLEEFNKLSETDRLLSIEELKKELERI